MLVMPCRAIWLNWNMFELCCGYLSVQLKRTELRELWKRELSTNDWLNELHELCDRHVLGCGLNRLHKLRSGHLPISSGGVELFELPDGDILSDNRCAVVEHVYRVCGRPVLVGHGGFGVNDLFRLRYRDVQCKYRLCVVFELHRRNILVVAIDRLHELRGRDVPNACRFEQLRRLRRRCLLHRDMCELRGGTVRCSFRFDDLHELQCWHLLFRGDKLMHELCCWHLSVLGRIYCMCDMRRGELLDRHWRVSFVILL